MVTQKGMLHEFGGRHEGYSRSLGVNICEEKGRRQF